MRKRSLVFPLVSLCALALPACSGRGTCPGPQTIVPGSSCHGEDLECPYDLPYQQCDGTPAVISSSCACIDDLWQCPEAQICQASDAGTDDSGMPWWTDAGSTSDAGSSTSSSGSKSRRGSSCPFVFAYNGQSFEYQTDLGGEIIGMPSIEPLSRAVRLYRMTYQNLPTARFDPAKGLELHIRETMAETSYFDEARLLLVDHPEGTEVWSSDTQSTWEWQYDVPFKIYTTRRPRAPVSATNRKGQDLLSFAAELDNRPMPVDPSMSEFYTFDFGTIEHPEHAKLLIDGWSLYGVFTRAENVEAHVEALDARGEWVNVRKFAPPMADLKTVVVDLGGQLPAGATKLRVHLGTRLYSRWFVDRVRLDDSEPAEVSVTTLAPAYASLEHRGRATMHPSTFLSRIEALDDSNPDEPAQYGYGAFTRFGDVLDLMKATDDRYVIMRHGDQLTVRFPGAPAPAPGHARTVLLGSDVYYKTYALERNVDPLPYHAMTSFPFAEGEHYPTDAKHTAYLEQYNTRLSPAP